jgi:hypothetical protein
MFHPQALNRKVRNRSTPLIRGNDATTIIQAASLEIAHSRLILTTKKSYWITAGRCVLSSLCAELLTDLQEGLSVFRSSFETQPYWHMRIYSANTV